MTQTVYVLVKVKLDPLVDPYKVISEIDYQFIDDGVVYTEIIDVAPLEREEHPYIAT